MCRKKSYFLFIQDLSIIIDFQLTIYIWIPVSNNCATFICASFDNLILRCLMDRLISKDYKATRKLLIDFGSFSPLSFQKKDININRRLLLKNLPLILVCYNNLICITPQQCLHLSRTISVCQIVQKKSRFIVDDSGRWW